MILKHTGLRACDGSGLYSFQLTGCREFSVIGSKTPSSIYVDFNIDDRILKLKLFLCDHHIHFLIFKNDDLPYPNMSFTVLAHNKCKNTMIINTYIFIFYAILSPFVIAYRCRELDFRCRREVQRFVCLCVHAIYV